MIKININYNILFFIHTTKKKKRVGNGLKQHKLLGNV